mmetsp:Transcript_24476/g.97102  ORF Transcript_24476/g.97102 Transcript_24476/m.97102 type:complete len:211 (+) Transcript_24476:1603-2235(+)
MMGVPMSEPKTPPLEMENVPPAMSSSASVPSLAFFAYAAIDFSTSANDMVSALRRTGTTRPFGEATATETSQYSRYTVSLVASSMYALTAGTSCSAAVEALTKADMKPSLTPWTFSNSSLHRLRDAMRLLMSHSWNVVSIAHVFCASLRRSAMRCRMRDILTRVSARDAAVLAAAPGSGGGGARTAGGALDETPGPFTDEVDVVVGGGDA